MSPPSYLRLHTNRFLQDGSEKVYWESELGGGVGEKKGMAIRNPARVGKGAILGITAGEECGLREDV